MEGLASRTLWLSVWDRDGIGRNQFLGEVRLPISSLDLNDLSPSWYTLQEKVRDRISQLHASESIHGMCDVTSGCSIAATLSIAVNGKIGRWAFEMCA